MGIGLKDRCDEFTLSLSFANMPGKRLSGLERYWCSILPVVQLYRIDSDKRRDHSA